MKKPRSKNRTVRTAPAKRMLRFDERGLPEKSPAAKREAFIAKVESNPGAHVEILVADQAGEAFWMETLRYLKSSDQPTLRVEVSGFPEKDAVSTDGEIDLSTMASIQASMFYSSRNAIYALESYCSSVEVGVYPDWPIIKMLQGGFRQSLENHRLNKAGAKDSLDHILGLSSKRGETQPYKTTVIAERNQMLCLDIARLRSLPLSSIVSSESRSSRRPPLRPKRLTVDEAAQMVVRRLKETPDWNKSGWKIANIGVGSLLKKYFRWPLHHKYEAEDGGLASKWSPENIREYLSRFPDDSLPPRLKIFLAK